MVLEEKSTTNGYGKTSDQNLDGLIAYLDIVEQIDSHLTRRTRHFYRDGKLLTSLDEVVLAILDGALS